MLKISNLTKKFKDKVIFTDTSFELPDNGLFLLKGKNGLGKTTLLNILNQNDLDYEGEVYYNDELLTTKNVEKYRGNIVHTIYQDNLFFDDSTVLQNIKRIASKKLTDEEALRYLKLVRLEDVKDSKPYNLSSGELKRLTIAMSLTLSPKIILCDEIINNLDNENVDIILEILKELAKDVLVVLVSHTLVKQGVFTGDIEINKNKIITKNESKEKSNVNKKETEMSGFTLFKNLFFSHKTFCIVSLVISFLLLVTSMVFNGLCDNNTKLEEYTIQVDREYMYSNFDISLYIDKGTELKQEDPLFKKKENELQMVTEKYSLYENDAFLFTHEMYTTSDYIFYTNQLMLEELTINEGRLPTNSNEVLISSVQYNFLRHYDYVRSIDDINKDGRTKIVVGVYQAKEINQDKNLLLKYYDYQNDFLISYLYTAPISVIDKEVKNPIIVFINKNFNLRDVSQLRPLSITFKTLNEDGNGMILKNDLYSRNAIFQPLNIFFLSLYIVYSIFTFILFFSINKTKLKIYRLYGVGTKSIVKAHSIFYFAYFIIPFLVTLPALFIANCIQNFGFLNTLSLTKYFPVYIPNYFFLFVYLGVGILSVLVFLIMNRTVLKKDNLSSIKFLKREL